MKTNIKFENTDNFQCTISTTMSLKEWKMVEKALDGEPYHSSKCAYADLISKSIKMAENQICTDTDISSLT